MLLENQRDYIRWKYNWHADLLIAYVEKYGEPEKSLDENLTEAIKKLLLNNNTEQGN